VGGVEFLAEELHVGVEDMGVMFPYPCPLHATHGTMAVLCNKMSGPKAQALVESGKFKWLVQTSHARTQQPAC